MYFNPLIMLAWLFCLAIAADTSCLTFPPLSLDAGKSQVSFSMDTAQGIRCEATLQFRNASFLPIHYSFTSIPCDSQRMATFTVPEGVPNGEATMYWQCAGAPPTCNRAVIANGTSDLSITLQSAGRVGCLKRTIQTTQTILTLTKPTTTVTQTIQATITTNSTVFPDNMTETGSDSLATTANSATTALTSPSSVVSTGIGSPTTGGLSNYTSILRTDSTGGLNTPTATAQPVDTVFVSTVTKSVAWGTLIKTTTITAITTALCTS